MVIIRYTKFSIFCVILSTTMLSFLYHMDSHTSLRILQAERSHNLKYILLWTRTFEPFMNLGEGTESFIHRKCSYTNCFVSSNKRLFEDVSDFDVILFEGHQLSDDKSLLPQSRSPQQKYIFASMESSANYPICDHMYNSYFNWTWTYKLDSEEYFGYISIRDKEGKVIGPKKEMHWEKVESMMPINDTLKAKLSTKKIAAAWFVSNCNTQSGRDLIGKQLIKELAKYNMQVDIFGGCGTKKCPRGSMQECLRKLETDYYFFLSFENSFAEDYVTEKLLHALKHYTVPVVYGGANYTRFMPHGVYLTARSWNLIPRLANEMANIINDKQKYYEFFKWHNHYTYHELSESRDTDAYCKLCALVNNQEKYIRTSVCKDFTHWWSTTSKCRHYDRLLETEVHPTKTRPVLFGWGESPT